MPTIDVKNICICTEKMVKAYVGNSPTKFDYNRLTSKILQNLDPSILSSQNMLDLSDLDSILYFIKINNYFIFENSFPFYGKERKFEKGFYQKEINKNYFV